MTLQTRYGAGTCSVSVGALDDKVGPISPHVDDGPTVDLLSDVTLPPRLVVDLPDLGITALLAGGDT